MRARSRGVQPCVAREYIQADVQRTATTTKCFQITVRPVSLRFMFTEHVAIKPWPLDRWAPDYEHFLFNAQQQWRIATLKGLLRHFAYGIFSVQFSIGLEKKKRKKKLGLNSSRIAAFATLQHCNIALKMPVVQAYAPIHWHINYIRLIIQVHPMDAAALSAAYISTQRHGALEWCW